MSDHFELLFPTFVFPLNVYAEALRLEYGEVSYLHYGLFTSSEDSLYEAQQASTERLLDLLPATPAKLLEIGIGLGTTARRLLSEGYDYTGITPDNNQILYCQRKHKGFPLEFIHRAFQDFSHDSLFDVLVFQESAQYIEASTLLSHSSALLATGGQIVILDEIPTGFLQATRPVLASSGYDLDYEEDVTELAAPSITILCHVIEKHARELLANLNMAEQQLDHLMTILRKREKDYAEGNFTYQLLRLVKTRD